jgi:hypothetical protein
MFYSPICPDCEPEIEALAAGERRWGPLIRVERRHLNNSEGFREFLVYEEHYGSKQNEIPKVFVGRQCLAGSKMIVNGLDEAIRQELAKGSVTFAPPRPEPAGPQRPPGGVPQEILARFRGFSVGAVVLAGLVDGINPCAFTTIVFLLSMLAYLGKSRRQLLAVGTGFTAAVFVTYFLLGLGILEVVKTFSVSHGISTALAYGVAVLAFVLAGWSLIDFIRYARTGDAKKVTLGLPKVVKSRIHKVIRVGLSTRGLIFGSVAVGFLVAVLESICTGQVYLPTIIFVARAPGLRADALGYLLLYNLMFILPLVAILTVAYFGVRSESLGGFLARHLGALKLALAVLFAGLGVLVLTTV